MSQPQRRRSPRGEGETLREDLLAATVVLIGHSGSVDQVSLRAAAASVGVSPTAVYRHFDDHQALMTAALVRCWETFESALVSAHDPLLDDFENFLRMGAAYTAFAANEPGMYRAMFGSIGAVGDEVLEVSLQVFSILVDAVADLLRANGDDRDPTYVATQVHTWMHGIVDLCRDRPSLLFPPAEDLVADLPVRLGLVPGAHAAAAE